MAMTENTDQADSNYWLELASKKIIGHYAQTPIVISSGISPSASYHIGHFREILTADALCWGVNQLKTQGATHVHVVDNFDPLRKCYDFLPASFEEFVGRPICLIPDPFDCHETYAEHYYQEFEQSARAMGIVPDKIVRSYEDLYRTGAMAHAIEQVLEKSADIRSVFENQSNRQLGQDWTPVMVLDENDHFSNARLSSWDKAARTIEGVDYTNGRAKLNWRLDWPARWSVLGVMVEPFSLQEHGAAGGSYDTGVVFSERVFDYKAPIPGVQYGNIHLVGDTKKMSSSKGNLITPAQALSIMPAELLRFFVVKSRPERTLYFDTGLGIVNLFNEYEQIEAQAQTSQKADFYEAYQFSRQKLDNEPNDSVLAHLPFGHLVTVLQTARGDIDRAITILERTGYDAVVADQRQILEREFDYIATWLSQYAPDKVKFDIQESLPKLELEPALTSYLDDLANSLASSDFSAQVVHDNIYEVAVAHKLAPAQAFKLIYQLFLGQDFGPKLGFFLSSMEQDFVLARLRRQS